MKTIRKSLFLFLLLFSFLPVAKFANLSLEQIALLRKYSENRPSCVKCGMNAFQLFRVYQNKPLLSNNLLLRGGTSMELIAMYNMDRIQPGSPFGMLVIDGDKDGQQLPVKNRNKETDALSDINRGEIKNRSAKIKTNILKTMDKASVNFSLVEIGFMYDDALDTNKFAGHMVVAYKDGTDGLKILDIQDGDVRVFNNIEDFSDFYVGSFGKQSETLVRIDFTKIGFEADHLLPPNKILTDQWSYPKIKVYNRSSIKSMTSVRNNEKMRVFYPVNGEATGEAFSNPLANKKVTRSTELPRMRGKKPVLLSKSQKSFRQLDSLASDGGTSSKIERFLRTNSYDLVEGRISRGVSHSLFARRGVRALKNLKLVRHLKTYVRYAGRGSVVGDAVGILVDTGFYVYDMVGLGSRDDLSGGQIAARASLRTGEWLSPAAGLIGMLFSDGNGEELRKALEGVVEKAYDGLPAAGYDYDAYLPAKLKEIETEIRDAGLQVESLTAGELQKTDEKVRIGIASETEFALVWQALFAADAKFLRANAEFAEMNAELLPAVGDLAEGHRRQMVETMLGSGPSRVSEYAGRFVYCALAVEALALGIEEKDFRGRCSDGFSAAEARDALRELYVGRKRSLLRLENEFRSEAAALVDRVYPKAGADRFEADFVAGATDGLDAEGVAKERDARLRDAGASIMANRLFHRAEFGGMAVLVDKGRYRPESDPAVKDLIGDDLSGRTAEIRRFLENRYFPYLKGEKVSGGAPKDAFPDWEYREVMKDRKVLETEGIVVGGDICEEFDNSDKKWVIADDDVDCVSVPELNFRRFDGPAKRLLPDGFRGLALERYLARLLADEDARKNYSAFFRQYLEPEIDDACMAEDSCLSKLAAAAAAAPEPPAVSGDVFRRVLRDYAVWLEKGRQYAPRKLYGARLLKIRRASDESSCLDYALEETPCSGGAFFPYENAGSFHRILHPEGGCLAVSGGKPERADCSGSEGWTNLAGVPLFGGVPVSAPFAVRFSTEEPSALYGDVPPFSSVGEGLAKLGRSTSFVAGVLSDLLAKAASAPEAVRLLRVLDRAGASPVPLANGFCLGRGRSSGRAVAEACGNSPARWWTDRRGRLRPFHSLEGTGHWDGLCLKRESDGVFARPLPTLTQSLPKAEPLSESGRLPLLLLRRSSFILF